MRILVTAALTAGATVLLAAPASARPCPDGTTSQYVTTVAGHPVYACLPPPVPCDPGPCDVPR